MRLHILGGSLLSISLATAAHAALLVNGSFETNATPTMPDNVVYVNSSNAPSKLPGWTLTAGTVDLVNNGRWAASDGNYSLDLIGTPGIGTVQQVVSGLTAGTQYILTFDFAVNPENGWTIPEAGTTKRLKIQASGMEGLLASSTYQATVGTRTATNMQYASQVFTFTADSSTATLSLAALAPLNLPTGLTASTAYCGPVVDNLVLIPSGGTTNVPEPASLSVLALGAAALLTRRSRNVL